MCHKFMESALGGFYMPLQIYPPILPTSLYRHQWTPLSLASQLVCQRQTQQEIREREQYPQVLLLRLLPCRTSLYRSPQLLSVGPLFTTLLLVPITSFSCPFGLSVINFRVLQHLLLSLNPTHFFSQLSSITHLKFDFSFLMGTWLIQKKRGNLKNQNPGPQD